MDLCLAVCETATTGQPMQIATTLLLFALSRRKRLLQLLELLHFMLAGSPLRELRRRVRQNLLRLQSIFMLSILLCRGLMILTFLLLLTIAKVSFQLFLLVIDGPVGLVDTASSS